MFTTFHRLPALLATSEYDMYYVLPALTAMSENYLYCIPPLSAPMRALPPFRPNPLNPRGEQYASRSSRAIALGGTVTVIDVDMRFEWIDEMLRCQKFILRPEP